MEPTLSFNSISAVQLANRVMPRYSFLEEPADVPDRTSLLGTPVYSNLTFKAEGITSLGNPNSLNPDEGKRDLVIDAVVITVQLMKNVVRTPIPGQDGTVKEFISNDDYTIQIMGRITSPYPEVFPEEDVTLLRQFCKANQEIAVLSRFLAIFQINNIVVMDARISQVPGTLNTVDFEIQAVSDEPYEIEL
jgi:hypothetical protein